MAISERAMSAINTNFMGGLAAAALCLATCAVPRIANAADPAMRIAFPSGMNGQIVVAMDKAGIARQSGLKAEFDSFQYGPPMMEALAAGSIDAVVTSLMPVTAYAAKIPGDVKIVAMVGQSSHSLMVDKDSGIAGPEALTGKKIGVSFGSDSHLDALVWLKQIGLSDKVSLVNIAPAELATALANKSVDAIVIRQPQVLRLQQQSGAQILHTWPFRFVSIVKTKFIAEHPQEVEKYLAGLRWAILFIAQNHQKSADWFGEYLRADPAIIQAVSKDDPLYAVTDLDQIDISVKPDDRALIGKWASDALEQKMIKRPLDLDSLFQ
jgi:ABC-type nitrate/sulfonate/bicarbonate transport system substrate-binding protein